MVKKLTRQNVEQIVGEAREKDETPNLRHADLRLANLGNVDLYRADLSQANLQGANLGEANLYGADLRRANLSEANLFRADLFRANLSQANLSGANLYGVNFSEANLSQAHLYGADLFTANLRGANLSQANLCRVNLGEARLFKANLREANLREADLNWADLSEASLFKASLIGADLSGADLTKVKLENTDFSQATVGDTILVNIDLSGALNLETVQHQSPSTIDMNTIYQSQNKIPRVFLIGAGIHPDIIRWQHSLHTRPTVFISYNHSDEQEKNQLLAHLSALQRNDLIDLWHDHRIPAGADWKEEIKKAMTRASVAILLISANFLNSDFIFEEEIPTFLKRRKSAEKLHIYPIIAKPCHWQAIDWLAEMEVRPKGGQPLWSKDADTDIELAKIADEITNIIKNLMFKQERADV